MLRTLITLKKDIHKQLQIIPILFDKSLLYHYAIKQNDLGIEDVLL